MIAHYVGTLHLYRLTLVKESGDKLDVDAVFGAA
jgi:hypothetical protein